MGFFDKIFSPSKTTTTTKVELPKWVEDAGKSNYAYAQQIAGKPYEAYGGEGVADLTSRQTGAFNMLDMFKPSAVSTGQTGIDMSQLGRFMDPYINDVVNATTGDMVRATEMQGETLDNAFQSGGAFGDARQGAYDAEMGKNLASEVGRMSAGLRSGGFQQALEALMREPNVEAQQINNALNYIGAQQGAGAIEQGQNQAELDWLKKLFEDKQGDPIEKLNILTSVLSATPYSKTQVSEQPGPSPFGQVAGPVASMFGAYYGAK